MPIDAIESPGEVPPGRPADGDLLRSVLDGATSHLSGDDGEPPEVPS
jgi:hypothetical protein